MTALAKDEKDCRVRAVAANSVLNRAFGKPREFNPEDADDSAREVTPDFARLTTDELRTLSALLSKATAVGG
jgi:hypothetical protein